LRNNLDVNTNIFWREEWILEEELGLKGSLAEEWEEYTTPFSNGNINLSLEEDELVWSKNCMEYTNKLAYSSLFVEDIRGNLEWWWYLIYKCKRQLKSNLFFWMTLSKKYLTWDTI
jgi:hypothetical protein